MSKLIVAAVMKNESHILSEWIRHYIDQGADKMILIDNGSTDDCLGILQPYTDMRLVDYVWDPIRHNQNHKYDKYILDKVPSWNKSAWILIVDLDEIVYGRDGKRLVDYLTELPSDVSQISIPWKLFGSSDHVKQPLSVIEGFVKRKQYQVPSLSDVKSAVKCDSVISFGIHHHNTRQGSHWDANMQDISECGMRFGDSLFLRIDEGYLNKSQIHLNHYAIQSWDWFCHVKMTRGSANCEAHDKVRDETYFKKYDHNDFVDRELVGQIRSS